MNACWVNALPNDAFMDFQELHYLMTDSGYEGKGDELMFRGWLSVNKNGHTFTPLDGPDDLQTVRLTSGQYDWYLAHPEEVYMELSL